MKDVKKYFAIIGYPVSHSLSPAMHNAAFKALKLPHQYIKIEVHPSQLKAFFKQLRNAHIVGLNVTIPHKETVLHFLDKLSKEAKLIGAVNTIKIQNKKLIGHNTDGAGFLQSLEEEKKWKPKGKKIVLLGAGGAARSILVSLSLGSAKQILLANRTPEKAVKLIREFKRKFPKVKFSAPTLQELKEQFKDTDLLINTTSGGMKGNPLPPLPLKALPRHAIVADIVYKPQKTKLLKNAQKLKIKTHPGLGMLLQQGALAFKIWTGRKAPLLVMKKALELKK